ncbi:MAG: acyltransferase family protein, partial [Akkermansia sp.]
MISECGAEREPEKEPGSSVAAVLEPVSGRTPRECWLDLGRVLGLFFIILFHASGNGMEFPLFFQRVPFLFMAAAYFVGRRKTFDWRHSPCRYILFYLAWNAAACLEAFFRHLIYLNLGYSSTWDWSMLPWKLTGVGTTFPYDGPLWFLKYVMALSMLSSFLFVLGKRRLLIPATVAVLFSVTLFPEINALFSDPPQVPWADSLAFFMMGFCLSSLTLGEIKLFLKKTSCLSLPAWVAIAWMNHCGVLSTETLHTIPCWIPGILGMGSLCVLLAEK